MSEQSNISRKVRYLRKNLGCRSTIVREMRAASTSSLKRWEFQKCAPIKAHKQLIDKTYTAVKRIEKRLSKKVEQQMMQMKMRMMTKKNRR